MAPFQTISFKDYGSGVDYQSSEDNIKPGFVESIINFDSKPEGYLSRRKGYESYCGWVPVRVQSFKQTTADTIIFTLDSSISASDLASTPIVVYGKTSVTANSGDNGDFDSSGNEGRYYSSFTLDQPKTFLTGSNTLSIPATEHGLTTPYLAIWCTTSDSNTDQSNTIFYPDSVSIDQSTYEITISYTNGTGAAFSGYIYIADISAVSGTSYNTGTITIASGGTTTTTITAATHGLSNTNIIVYAFADDGSSYELVKANDVVIKTTGNVEITMTNSSADAVNYEYILVANPVANNTYGTVTAGATNTVTISTLDTNFIMPVVYLEQPDNDLEECIPDEIEVDAVAGTATISFTNGSADDAQFFIYWDFETLKSSAVAVTAQVHSAVEIIDTTPQLTIWGLNHAELYNSAAGAKAGWVTHIDSYRSSDDSRLVCGLGGNLYVEGAYDNYSDSHLFPLLYPNIYARLSHSRELGPAFISTGETSSRTSGTLSFDTISTNVAHVNAITYDEATGWVKYTISTPNLIINGSLEGAISTYDWLTVTQTMNQINSGSFRIHNVVNNGDDTISIWVDNPTITTADWDETNGGAWAGVFTDLIIITSDSPFLIGDTILCEGISEAENITIASISANVIILNNITTNYSLSKGLKIIGKRSGRVLPLRTLSGTASVTNLVRGDMLECTDVTTRKMRVVSINPHSDINLTITGDGSEAIALLDLGNTSSLEVGKRVLIIRSDNYSGEHIITDIPSSTTFKFSSTHTGTESGVLLGKTVELDEYYSNIKDSTNNSISYKVNKRWIPVEAPTDSYSLTADTYVEHFTSEPYDDKPFIRSVMVQNNLYLTNGYDPVQKFDGTNICRAGLPRWQPQLFISTINHPTSGGVVDVPSVTVSYTATGTNKFTVAAGDELSFSVGDTIKDANDDAYYTVVSIPSGYVVVDKTIAGLTRASTISKVFTRKYYLRLNAIDANDNIIASAVTGADDLAVRLTDDAQVRLRAVGLPAWDNYDYDRLEVQIYGTQLGSSAPFYLLTTLPMSFNNAAGYIDFIDSYSDDTLNNLDVVNTALLGQELGTQMEEPMRAKYCTSAGNSLILANLKDYPELDIRLVPSTGNITAASMAGNIWTFRKDNTSTSTITDNLNVQRFEMINSGAVTINSFNFALTATNFTITSIGHGLSAGNWVYLFHEDTLDDHCLNFAGWWQIASVTNDTFTIKWTNSCSLPATQTFTDAEINDGTDVITITGHGYEDGDAVQVKSTGTLPTNLAVDTTYYVIQVSTNTFKLAASYADALAGTQIDITGAGGAATHSIMLDILPDRYVTATTPTDIPVYLGTDYNYGMLNGNRSTTGPYEFLAMRRLSNAINVVQRMVDTSVTGQSTFSPWMTAAAGNEYDVGQLVVRFPKVLATTPEVMLPNFSGFNIFTNSIKRAANAEVGANTKLYPSRLLISYPNFPELFDNPRAILDTESSSAVDVNAADGQEITGIIPFFGDSAFGDAQKTQVIVVFKTNSIYLVNLASKAAGQNAVVKVDSQGLGCTSPYSIAATRNGISFANESGIYRLNHQLTIDPLGQKLYRYYRDTVNKDQLALAQGHHYALERQYKLSIPINSNNYNSNVLVYDHTREYQGQDKFGSWSIYDNHLATGWANLAAEAFFGATHGEVYRIRNSGSSDDFRDDNEEYESTIILAASDFGDSGIQKLLGSLVAHFRTEVSTSAIALYSDVDFENAWNQLDAFELTSNSRINTLKFSLGRRKFIFVQLKLVVSAVDTPVELTAIDYRVSGLSDKGIKEGADS